MEHRNGSWVDVTSLGVRSGAGLALLTHIAGLVVSIALDIVINYCRRLHLHAIHHPRSEEVATSSELFIWLVFMLCRYFCTFISSCPSWNWPAFYGLLIANLFPPPLYVCVFVFSTYKSLVNEMSRKQACEKVYNCSLTNPKDEWGGHYPLSIGKNVSGPLKPLVG